MGGWTADLLELLDPLDFAVRCGISSPDPWQLEALEADMFVDAAGFRRDQLWLCCRGAGKSTTAALIGTRQMYYHPRTLTVVASPTQEQSRAVFDPVGEFLDNLGAEIVQRSTKEIKLLNGSRILARHGKEENLRGIQGVSLLLLDEASRVDSDLIGGLTPTLGVKKGRMIALSTPAGRHPDNWFFRIWHADDNEWRRVKVSADECPRLTPEHLERERRRMTDMEFRENYYLEFLDSELAAFPVELIERAFTDEFSAWAL